MNYTAVIITIVICLTLYSSLGKIKEIVEANKELEAEKNKSRWWLKIPYTAENTASRAQGNEEKSE